MRFRTLLIAAGAALVSGLLVAQAQVPGVNSTLNSVFTLAYDNSTMKPTYSATSVVAVTNTGTVNDVCALSGSATKTLKVRRVIVGGQAGAVETLPVGINKYSSLYTNGNGARPTITSYDSSNAAVTGVVETWADVNPTRGALVGTLADLYVGFVNSTTGVNNPSTTFEFGRLGQPIVLRGVAQYVSVDLSAVFASGKLSCTFEWTEES